MDIFPQAGAAGDFSQCMPCCRRRYHALFLIMQDFSKNGNCHAFDHGACRIVVHSLRGTHSPILINIITALQSHLVPYAGRSIED